MTPLLQVCAVIVTIAIVAIAFVLVRTLAKFEKTAEQLSETAISIRDSLEQFQVLSRRANDLVTSLQEVVPHIRRTAERIESLGTRAAGLSSSLLEAVETPVHTVTAIIRGVRTGATSFLQKLKQRFVPGAMGNASGYSH